LILFEVSDPITVRVAVGAVVTGIAVRIEVVAYFPPVGQAVAVRIRICLLYTSPSPRD